MKNPPWKSAAWRMSERISGLQVCFYVKSAIEIRYLADMRADIRSSSVFLCKIRHENPLPSGYASGYQVFKCVFMQNPP